MYTVNQQIFAKQNWTVTAADIQKNVQCNETMVETYWLEGKRGSQAILLRTVNGDKYSTWSLIRGAKIETVTVYEAIRDNKQV